MSTEDQPKNMAATSHSEAKPEAHNSAEHTLPATTILIVFVLISFAGIATYFLSTREPSSMTERDPRHSESNLTSTDNLVLGIPNKVQIKHDGTQLSAYRESTTRPWVLESFSSGTTAQSSTHNLRIDPNTMAHFLDLVYAHQDALAGHSIHVSPPETQATLEVSLAWENPTPGKEVLRLFQIDSGTYIMNFLSKGFSIETTSVLARFLEAKPLSAFIDRRISTFSLDDVETFSWKGQCGLGHAFRNGDHWRLNDVEMSTQISEKLEKQLESFLSSQYTAVSDQRKGNRWCQINIKGRLQKEETISIDRIDKTFSFTASDYQGVYIVNEQELRKIFRQMANLVLSLAPTPPSPQIDSTE